MPTAPISRRALLRGDLRGERAPLRPPWAVPEPVFTAACDRCGDCLKACPEQIIRIGDGGYPLVDFASGGCSFCGDCLVACDGKALQGAAEHDSPWELTARIGDECLAYRGVICRSCGEACDLGVVRFRPRVGGAAEPNLHYDRCTGCGHCVRVCPVQAVRVGISAQAHAGRAG